MISRKARAAYYGIAGPVMWLNSKLYRAFRAPRRPHLRVQLGPGKKNYIPGWLNLDANIVSARPDVWADLRNPLPFHDGSVECFYSHHVIEHLPNLQAHLADAFRALQPGGVYRMAGPNGDAAMKKFVEGDIAWFNSNFPDKRRSLGGRLENFLCCRGEHVTLLTFSFLDELLLDAGFARVNQCLPGETAFPDLFTPCLPLERDDYVDLPHTLVVEAVKAR